MNYTSIKLLKCNMPKTLLHSWTSSIHHEGKFPSKVTLVLLGMPSLQHLEEWGLWSYLLFSTYLHVIPYSEMLLGLYNYYSNFLQDKVDITYLSFQRKEDFGTRTKVTTVIPLIHWGMHSKTPPLMLETA